MEKENKKCKVCGIKFESEDGLVSCPAHSFGEREEVSTPPPTDEQSQKEGWRAKWKSFRSKNGIATHPADIEEFIGELLSQERTKVREEIEGMKVSSSSSAVQDILTYNQALADLLTRLEEN